MVTLQGIEDPGGVRRYLDEHIFSCYSHHPIIDFDIDELCDYSAHRPMIVFDRDHFRDYHSPQIRLHQCHDSALRPFLLLNGPEPALRWEAMCEAIAEIIDTLDIHRVVIVCSVPAPTPHTRPVYISQFASRPELIGVFDGIPAAIQLSAAFSSLLTMRLGAQGIDVYGLIAHIPHYLADGEYPPAALAVLDRLMDIHHLDLPASDSLKRQGEWARQMVDEHVKESEEFQRLLVAIEEQYDQFIADQESKAKAEIPSGDQLSAEIEAYLSALEPSDESHDIDRMDDCDHERLIEQDLYEDSPHLIEQPSLFDYEEFSVDNEEDNDEL